MQYIIKYGILNFFPQINAYSLYFTKYTNAYDAKNEYGRIINQAVNKVCIKIF